MNILKGIFIGLIGLVLLGSGAIYFSRDLILEKVMEKVQETASARHVQLKIDSAYFTGLAAVAIRNVSAVPENRDTLLTLKKMGVSIRLWPLLIGRIQPDEMLIDGCKIQVTKKDSISNIDFLFDRDTTQKSPKRSLDFGKLANNLLNQLLYKVPDHLEMRDCIAFLNDNGIWVKAELKECSIKDYQLIATTVLSEATDTTTIRTEGSINAGKKQMNIRMYGNGKPILIPYINEKYQAKVQFDTLSTAMNDVDYSDDLAITGRWSVSNLLINHPKISPTDVKVSSASIDCKMLIGKNFICIDSSSTAYLKNVKAHPYLKYTTDTAKVYELKLKMDDTPAQDLFDCFPTGLFQNLEGIKVSGQLRYALNFKLDTAHPDSVEFDSGLTGTDFKIQSYGNVNLQKINGSFVYTPYEYGRPMRGILVGSDNPNFTPYDAIPACLRNAVITAEDGTFTWHKGFNEEAFRNAIAVNYKEGRFKKGASTITMQLVKNIFLNRSKNVTRKLEEALIVWLIENNHLSSKQRMLEVYLNIIEWGPNVYGIGEAAHFYFGKAPAQLTLGESIFLASIVPKPKAFKYSFDEKAQLKPFVRYFFRLITGKMMRRGFALETDTVNLFSGVQLTGPAANFIVPSDSIPNLEDREEEEESSVPPSSNSTPSNEGGIKIFSSSLAKDNPDGKTARDDERKRKKEERLEERKRKKEERQQK